MTRTRFSAALTAMAIAGMALAVSARADSALDRVVKSGTLRCGVMLDSPPAGFRDAQNQPTGYDVEYCQDMAKALGVKAEIVETPSPQRIPALISNRIDVAISGMSNTLQRQLTVAFSQPYVAYTNCALTRKDTGIAKFDDLKGRKLGGVTGTSTEQQLQGFIKDWNDPNTSYTGYASDSDSFLALEQHKVDALIDATAVATALIRSGQFPDFTIGAIAPTPPDTNSIAVHRDDQQFLNWVRLFVWSQVRTGRYQELYNKYIGPGPAPSLSVAGVDY
jgi:ABC-type amino acid transport substrate-binding protein